MIKRGKKQAMTRDTAGEFNPGPTSCQLVAGWRPKPRGLSAHLSDKLAACRTSLNSPAVSLGIAQAGDSSLVRLPFRVLTLPATLAPWQVIRFSIRPWPPPQSLTGVRTSAKP